jgi:plastocyanin
MIDFDFSPRVVSAAPGDTITWLNRGSAIHTATADGRAFDSGIVSPGGRFTFRPLTSGTFAYSCTVHPSMRGTVTVVARGGPAPAVVAPTVTPAHPAPPSPPAAPASGPVGDAPPASASVGILDFEFSPPRVRVAVGGEVTWTNQGAAPHTATDRNQSYDSGMLAPQGTFIRRFDNAGTYDYICLVHPNMVGVVEVGAVTGGARDVPDAPVVTTGTGSGPESAAAPPSETATAALAAGVTDVNGGGRFVWVPFVVVLFIFGALGWANFGPPPVERGPGR